MISIYPNELYTQHIFNCRMKNQTESRHHNYTRIDKVGSGNFGEAWLVKSSIDSKQYIMKKISLENRTKQAKEQILKEIKLMQELKHVYVVRYLESFRKDKSVCIVMEYAERGDLDKYLQERKKTGKPLSEEQILEWLIQLLYGLKYIHEKNVMHRDFKPDNIFITATNHLKIGDFGISKLMTETFDLAKTKIGTPLIMAPEIWEGMKYNQKSDIWSLGCVLFKMMTLHYPFEAENSGALMYKIMNKKLPRVTGNYSKELKELALKLLDFQATNRPSVHKILEMGLIKSRMGLTLQKTINLYDQNMGSREVMSRTPSSNNILKKRGSNSLSGSMLPALYSTPHEHTKMVEYKQNYPMLVEENKQLKTEIEELKKGRNDFEENFQQLLLKVRQSTSMSKDEVIDQFQQLTLNFLYP